MKYDTQHVAVNGERKGNIVAVSFTPFYAPLMLPKSASPLRDFGSFRKDVDLVQTLNFRTDLEAAGAFSFVYRSTKFLLRKFRE